jgi:hypothetical protein
MVFAVPTQEEVQVMIQCQSRHGTPANPRFQIWITFLSHSFATFFQESTFNLSLST